jgi:hypothetical protein
VLGVPDFGFQPFFQFFWQHQSLKSASKKLAKMVAFKARVQGARTPRREAYPLYAAAPAGVKRNAEIGLSTQPSLYRSMSGRM